MEIASCRTVLLSDTDSPAVMAWHTQWRQYYDLLRQNHSAFWCTCIDAEQSQPSRLWRSFDELFGRGRRPLSLRHLQKSTHRTCTVSSTTKSLAYVPPLLMPMRHTPRQSAVCCGFLSRHNCWFGTAGKSTTGQAVCVWSAANGWLWLHCTDS